MTGVNMPSIRHLRVFAMVAELQSVRKAAEAVFLSQPAVTQAIAKVESQVGAVLFERRSSGTYLSDAGNILASRTRRMFSQIEDALAAFGLSNGKQMTTDAVAQRITRSQIRGVMAIASGSSFTDAAEDLHISQVSLYRAARDLERTLGSPLFYNGPSGITPMPTGIELARKLSIAMKEIEWAIEEIKTAAGKLGGELRIGAMPLAGSFLLGPVLNEITTYFPKAHINVRTEGCTHLARALHMGEVDFVVGLNRSSVNPAEIEQEALISSPYVVVARKGHPLANKNRVTATDLEAYDWIAPSYGAVRRQVWDQLFASMKNPPSANIEAYSLSTMRTLIDESDRLTLLTKFEYEYERGGGALVMLPYPPIEPVHTTGVAWRAKWTPTPLHLKFLELLRARAAKITNTEKLGEAA